MLTIGSCFSGIGGLELGLEWTGGFETKWQIENDPYATSVLQKHWPKVQRFSDIRDVIQPPAVDLICGGFPCQPFSLAGTRGGETDGRNLWPYMFRIIRHVRPRFALLENVPGLLSLGFGRVLGDLSEIGYDAEWSIISACSVGAPHSRERLFVIAYPASKRGKVFSSQDEFRDTAKRDSENGAFEKWSAWNDSIVGLRMEVFRRAGESGVHGISARVQDQSHRLRCLGNAVVPQVAQKIGEMILNFERR